MKEGSQFFVDEFGIFHQNFSRYAQSSSNLSKTFLFVSEACKYIDKGNYVAMYRKK